MFGLIETDTETDRQTDMVTSRDAFASKDLHIYWRRWVEKMEGGRREEDVL